MLLSQVLLHFKNEILLIILQNYVRSLYTVRIILYCQRLSTPAV